MKESLTTAALRSLTLIIGTIVDRFGWPGALLIFGAFYLEKHASPEEHHEIIQKYFLGHGIASAWPLVVLSLLFVAVLVAQHHLYAAKTQKLQKRLNELADEKTVLQEQLVGRPLRHGAEIATQSAQTQPPAKPVKKASRTK
jgi:hypothetical protein